MLSYKTRRNIQRILPFGLIWLFLGWVFLIVEYAASGNSSCFPETAIHLNLPIFIFASLAVMAVGLLIGTIELFYLNPLFVKKSFSKKLLYKGLVYAVFLFIVILITFPIAASFELNTSIFDQLVWQKYFDFLSSITNLSTGIQMAVSLLLSLFYAEISENIGHGVLLNFFTGKYHSPTSEKRIFLFADMKSSTAIAEQLGHIQYFEFLREYYFSLSNAIVKNAGEVYQYIGDEIVISWKLKEGLKGNHCLHCFWDMKADLQKKNAFFLQQFGVTPDFKAALHVGEVTTGELGALKKEIIFTGDVLNVTARLQEQCKEYNEDLLLSGELYALLSPDKEWQGIKLDEKILRGKKEGVQLFTIKAIA